MQTARMTQSESLGQSFIGYVFVFLSIYICLEVFVIVEDIYVLSKSYGFGLVIKQILGLGVFA